VAENIRLHAPEITRLPHPEERVALEGWATEKVLATPFETRSCGQLLRVR
jgi:hypothetical protein